MHPERRSEPEHRSIERGERGSQATNHTRAHERRSEGGFDAARLFLGYIIAARAIGALEARTTVTQSTPSWPLTSDPIAWLKCTAAWGLRIPIHVQESVFAMFPIDRLLRREMRIEAKPFMAQLEAKLRDEGADASRCVALAEAYLDIGDAEAAQRTMGYLLHQAESRRSSREYNVGVVLAFFHDHAASEPSDSFGELPQRISARKLAAMVHAAEQLVSTRALVLYARRATRTPDEPASVAELERRARAALQSLTPDEWNVDGPALALAGAISSLVARGEMALGEQILTEAMARFDSGTLDSRGFASGGAYVYLAKAIHRLRGADAAKYAIMRGLEVAGEGRQMVLPEVVSALLDVGAADEALVQAKKISKRRRCEVLAEVYMRTEAWAPLATLLAPVDDPILAARIAWAMVHVLEGDGPASRTTRGPKTDTPGAPARRSPDRFGPSGDVVKRRT